MITLVTVLFGLLMIGRRGTVDLMGKIAIVLSVCPIENVKSINHYVRLQLNLRLLQRNYVLLEMERVVAVEQEKNY